MVAALIYRAREILIVRRGPAMSGAGHWEFPGGKVEQGESDIQALKREIMEELSLKIRVEEYFGDNVHQYATKKIHLKFYWVPMPFEEIALTEHDALSWVRPADLDIQTLSEGDRPIVDALKNHPRMKP